MATIVVQTTALDGVEFTGNSADAGGDTFANDGKTYVFLANGDGSPTTATFVTTGTSTSAGLAIADMPVVITNAKTEMVGPFPEATFGSTVSITYSSVTSLVVDVVKLAG